MAWIIGLSYVVALGILLAIADQKRWLRTSKVLRFLTWFLPF
jgi:hypothetical protein